MKLDLAFLLFLIGTIILLMFAITLIMFLIHHKRKQQLHITEKMNLEHQYQSQLLQSRLEVQEQAFKYLSEEIHDNVGQALSMVKLQLYALNQQAADNARPLIHSTSEVLSKAINDLRNISHNLHGGYVIQHGLQEAIEKEIAYINGAKAIHADIEVKGNVYPLPKEKELLIFRIVQEALNNAIKHSGASLVVVCLTYMPECFSVSIEDNGKGMNTKQIPENGIGLSNMKTRADLLHAIYTIRSADEGTCISLTLNLDEDEGKN